MIKTTPLYTAQQNTIGENDIGDAMHTLITRHKT